MAMDLLSKITYPRKLFLWLVGYSVLLTGSLVVFQYYREKTFKAEEFNTRLQLINTYIITELGNGRNASEIDLNDFHPAENMRVSVIDRRGNLLYDNMSDTLAGANHLGREEIRQAMAAGSGYTVRRHSESTGNTYFYSATKADDGMIVRTAVPYTVSLSSLLRADYSFLWIMGGISVIMCILGYFATRRLGLHIMRLNRFAEKVESGERICDTEPFPDDELGSISNHIVRLYARLQQASMDRDNEHRAALHEQREKERIKKQLTNNINHELKTPVASIRVCLETLMAHKSLNREKQEFFLQRCMNNIERLQRLLSDVSIITRMDDGSASIAKEAVNLTDIIGSAVSEHRIIARGKGIDIKVDIAPDIIIEGNRSLLEAVFDNLLDNAIAYSGGSIIHIYQLSVDEERIELGFYDNGAGITDEHMPRIFERFYRIDKGRSRASGGTGLGLAIVKNAVNFHGGNITAENLPGGGLLFRITLARR